MEINVQTRHFPPGGVFPIVVGYRGGSARKRCLFEFAASKVKGRENCHFSLSKSHKIGCKVEEMVAKAKYTKKVPHFGRNNNAEHIHKNLHF